MIIHLCSKGSSEKPTRGPQFIFDHLRMFLQNPLLEIFIKWFAIDLLVCLLRMFTKKPGLHCI